MRFFSKIIHKKEASQLYVTQLASPFGCLHLVGRVSYIKMHLFLYIFLLMLSLISSKFTNSKINHWKLRHCCPSLHLLILVADNSLTFNGNILQRNRWRKQNKWTPFGSIKSVQCKQKGSKIISRSGGKETLKTASQVHILFPSLPNLWWIKPSSFAIKRGGTKSWPYCNHARTLSNFSGIKIWPSSFHAEESQGTSLPLFPHTPAQLKCTEASHKKCQLFNSAQHLQTIWARKKIRMKLMFPVYYTFSSQLWGGIWSWEPLPEHCFEGQKGRICGTDF